MYDHIGIRVNDLDASIRFYTAALVPLGYILCSKDASGAGFGPKGEPALWLHLHKGEAPTGAHIAFRAPNHDAIGKFHREGIKAGGRDNGAPGPRKDYSPTYFAAFLIDPDSNNVEALHVRNSPWPQSARTSPSMRTPTPSGTPCAISARCING